MNTPARHRPAKGSFVPFCIVLGVSLFVIVFRFTLPGGQRLTLAVADVTIGLLLFYGLLRAGSARVGAVFWAAAMLASVLLLSAFVNSQLDPRFDTGDFAVDYIRIVALVGMVLLLPGVILRLGHERLARNTLRLVKLYCVMIIAHSFFVPTPWNPDAPPMPRPSGIFGEPSFFGIYVLLSVVYVLQFERNTGVRLIRPFDIILLAAGLVTSTSISSMGALCLIFVLLLKGGRHTEKAFVGGALAVLVIGISVLVSRDAGPAKSLQYLAGRLPATLSGFEDSSSRARIIGSALLTVEVLKEAPLLGKGLGGSNLNRLFDDYVQHDRNRVSMLSISTTPAVLIGAGGIFGFVSFAFIWVWLLAARDTRWVGVSLILVGFMIAPFEPIIWWYICLGVSLRGTSRRAPAGAPAPAHLTARLQPA